MLFYSPLISQDSDNSIQEESFILQALPTLVSGLNMGGDRLVLLMCVRAESRNAPVNAVFSDSG